MNINPIYEVSFDYKHLTNKQRKRNTRIYNKKICVRASCSEASHSIASQIFVKLHPNTRIISINDTVYPNTCINHTEPDYIRIRHLLVTGT